MQQQQQQQPYVEVLGLSPRASKKSICPHSVAKMSVVFWESAATPSLSLEDRKSSDAAAAACKKLKLQEVVPPPGISRAYADVKNYREATEEIPIDAFEKLPRRATRCTRVKKSATATQSDNPLFFQLNSTRQIFFDPFRRRKKTSVLFPTINHSCAKA